MVSSANNRTQHHHDLGVAEHAPVFPECLEAANPAHPVEREIQFVPPQFLRVAEDHRFAEGRPLLHLANQSRDCFSRYLASLAIRFNRTLFGAHVQNFTTLHGLN